MEKTKKKITSPQKEKKSLFMEKWSRPEEVNAYLGLSLFATVSVCIVLTVVLVIAVFKPKPVYYIPGAKSAGVAWPNQIEKSSIVGFAQAWIMNWTNFTPVTINDVYLSSIKYMSPKLLSKTRAKLDQEIAGIKNNSQSSLFSLTEEPVIEEIERGYSTVFRGEKTVYIGKEKIVTQKIIYTVYLKTRPPTEINPYGLLVDDLKQEVIVQ